MHDPGGVWREVSVWDNKPYADMALGAVARGDMVTAEGYVDKALYRNPKDPYALYAAGVVYQNTGRPRKARQAYQELLSLNTDGPAVVAGATHLGHKQLSDLAENNLKLLDTATGNEMLGAALVPTGEAPPLAMPSGTVRRQDLSQLDLGPSDLEKPESNSGTAAAAKRFEVFRRLLGEGLVTEDEYQVRWAKNIGALLPLSKPVPGAGLERPVPKAEEISERLKALRTAFEIRSISAAEHAAERTTILDSLLPATPTVMAGEVPPPSDLIEAGAMSGRLARLRAAGLITPEEMAKEKAAIEKAVRGSALAGAEPRLRLATPRGASAAAPKPPKGKAPPKGKPVAKGKDGKAPAKGKGSSGAHLASYKTKAAAEEGWRELKTAFPDLLGKFTPAYPSANLGDKGTVLRLVVGPMKGDESAALCRQLVAKHQFCASIGY